MKVKQIRYYGDNDSRNSLDTFDSSSNLINQNDSYDEIQIKAYPGTIIKINSVDVIIGEIGIYNILYNEDFKITSLIIDQSSLTKINNISLAYIIITLTQYDKETEGDDTNDTGNTETPKPVEEENSSDDGTSSSDSQEEIIKDNHDSRP